MTKVIEAVHEIVTQGKVPAKDIAKAVDKKYSTLLRETNPCDTGAKLGVETLMGIIQATGDARPLELMARELGYQLLPAKK
uniref:phage regulatory CII family protein n=1 Tax=uncultured Bilophila sp. TaxID=529385 RepID=UPI0025DA82FB|nr:phage regulatory CII family protein [uncultured Bilophila sp.]